MMKLIGVTRHSATLIPIVSIFWTKQILQSGKPRLMYMFFHELCTVRSWAWVVSSVAKGCQSTHKFACCCSDPNKTKVKYQKIVGYVISYLKIISCQQGFS